VTSEALEKLLASEPFTDGFRRSLALWRQDGVAR
jgi:hypothetical protein